MEIIERVMDMQFPVFHCPVKRCNIESFTLLELKEHLRLDHQAKELLNLFDWDVKDGEIVIKNGLTANHPYIDAKIPQKRSIDKLICVDDTDKKKKEIATYLVKNFLDCYLLPNVSKTKIYNVMANYSHVATVDCWTYDKKDLIWSYVVIHDGGKIGSIEREIYAVLENRDDRIEIAKEIALKRYDEY